MDHGAPRGGTRDNGLRCANYAAIADLDPRVADSLLSTLRDAGIAAYAVPTPGSVGGAMETRLPPRPTDRLWVDDQRIADARDIVDVETSDDEPEPDIDAAWQQVLASLQSTGTSPVPPWPVSEDLDSPAGSAPVLTDDDLDDDEDEFDGDDHYVPPPPPPLPRLQPATIGALGAIIGGLLVLAFGFDGGSLTGVAILAILGGVASLVYRMRKGPPTDSGWDDGAVV